MPRRAVITGVGVVAPSGIGADRHWKSILDGANRLGAISLFDAGPYETTLAGEVSDFDVRDHVEDRLAVQTDRWTWMSFAATAEALTDAALEVAKLDPYSVAVSMASSSGGNLFGQRELQRLWSQPVRTVSAYQSIAWFYAASVGQLSIKHGLKGPSSVLVSEGAGGLDSFAHAARLIRRGVSVVLAGGNEAPLSPYALACQQRNGWLSASADPTRAYRPFDVDASGHVPGEGGAVFVVEDLDHALARGAPTIYAEVSGWGATHDGQPTRRGGGGSQRQLARAMRLAIERAGLQAGDVGVVFPDALRPRLRRDRGRGAASGVRARHRGHHTEASCGPAVPGRRRARCRHRAPGPAECLGARHRRARPSRAPMRAELPPRPGAAPPTGGDGQRPRFRRLQHLAAAAPPRRASARAHAMSARRSCLVVGVSDHPHSAAPLEYAAAKAAREHGEVIAVHVRRSNWVASLYDPSNAVMEWADGCENLAFARTMAALSGRAPSWRFVSRTGDVAACLADEAARRGASAVIIGENVRRGPLARLVRPRLASSLIRRGISVIAESGSQSRRRSSRGPIGAA